MTEAGEHMPEREALAAEYVLGTLPLAERLAAEALIDSDAAFAALVEAWRDRLGPLNAAYVEVAPPPGLLDRIEARLFPQAPRKRRFLTFRGALGGLAVAALAAIVVSVTLMRPAPITATLTGAGQPLMMAASYDTRAHELTVRRTEGPAAEAGKDYELWIIPAGQAPISIGVVRDAALSIPLQELPEGATLAITLETLGGSPTGAPQGPLLVAAVIGDS
ncbi:MAG: anti-sigma factor [Defluviimonas sp.]|uniref:anti-sigma factor n=1 Tax=Albidovulum sp. TaxID=1872424 RepID=UPI001DECC14C|nr:anti-sigma factor [Paracoccaceae bacterium]MCC0064243.1 anti-sigma factor [Defluviimonas sp.]